jgi:adenylate/nucleoside-diphosphate kinase
LAWTAATTTVLKEAYGEENVKEIGIDGSLDDVWVRVQTELDPFYVRADDEALVRGPADVQEGDDPLPAGDFGPFCAVTYRKTGWLVPGKDDFVALVHGRVYKFFSEKELKEFRENVEVFEGARPVAGPPRVMMVGVRGSGLRT